MLITFKSAASCDVMMFEKNAKDALDVFGKDPKDPQGIITVEQLPGALAALKLAIAAGRPKRPDEADNAEDPADRKVGFWLRAVPLAELLERSLKDGVPVVWGV